MIIKADKRYLFIKPIIIQLVTLLLIPSTGDMYFLTANNPYYILKILFIFVTIVGFIYGGINLVTLLTLEPLTLEIDDDLLKVTYISKSDTKIVRIADLTTLDIRTSVKGALNGLYLFITPSMTAINIEKLSNTKAKKENFAMLIKQLTSKNPNIVLEPELVKLINS